MERGEGRWGGGEMLVGGRLCVCARAHPHRGGGRGNGAENLVKTHKCICLFFMQKKRVHTCYTTPYTAAGVFDILKHFKIWAKCPKNF